MSESLHFAEHTLQEIALVVMACVYTIRLVWVFRFKAGKERQMATGLPHTSKRKGILYSWGIIAMPWAMESSRKNLLLYLQFVWFHLGVTASIAMSFFIPYTPGLMEGSAVKLFLQVLIFGSFAIGVIRIIRRVAKLHMRAISSPDDYFSLVLITVWFFFAGMSVPNNPANGEAMLLAYFWLTAFFLIYVPFSKISHYLYYPITRYYFGKSMGHRGGFPLRSTKA